MASAFAFGYIVAVPVLTALTDRVDARNILLVGSPVFHISGVRCRRCPTDDSVQLAHSQQTCRDNSPIQ
jgi:predicted MFS family arabinose efflux permease